MDMRDEDEGKAQRAIQSIEVGGRLLLALAEQAGPMTLKDLAAASDLTPSRAHPYLVSFGKLRLIEQDPASGRYALGPAALQVGLACLHQSDPLKAAGPVAESLARRIDQAVAIAVWANFGPTVVRIIESSQPLHVNMRVGTVMSIVGTATGRAFAGVLPMHRLQQAVIGGWGDERRGGGGAATTLEAERPRIVGELQAHGLTRAVGHPIPGLNALSAPVFDHEGQCALVITALGHEETFDPAWDGALAQSVRDAAAEISRRLGHLPAAR